MHKLKILMHLVYVTLLLIIVSMLYQAVYDKAELIALKKQNQEIKEIKKDVSIINDYIEKLNKEWIKVYNVIEE